MSTPQCPKAQQACRPRIGKPAPDFSGATFHAGKFGQVSNADFNGKWVVLFFYPLDFTFVCPTEIINFHEANTQFEAAGAQIIGCSVDSVFSHLFWSKLPVSQGGIGELAFPLIGDINKKVAKNFDTLIEDGNDAGVALRSTFIIDPKGVLRHMSYSDLGVGRNVEETLRLVQAFQYADENGEVCPSKWKKKGDKTMKADHADPLTKEYFQSTPVEKTPEN